MKTLLVAVNAKYSHTSLSVRTLSANAGGVDFLEFTINEDITSVASEIYNTFSDVVCFSCYIWNIEFVLKLASLVKKMTPDLIIVFGGPEVTFCAEEVLAANSFVDAVIRGEGEETFKQLIENGFNFKNTDGVTYMSDKIIKNNDRQPVYNLDSLVFPYTDSDLMANRNKLIYYESSRGCPYNCSYCLSSTIRGVRFKSLDKVKSELLKIIKVKPKTIKFTDRTFNADASRTVELIEFLKKNGEGAEFHFEIEAHTLTDEFFSVIKDAPKGMFRFEIGLQSSNPDTLRAIDRSDKTERLYSNVKRITNLGNIHVHLDLIAGLPHETLNIFKKSFNDALSLNPDVLQVGFLKLLKGTKIRGNESEYDYIYRDYPPYEVVSNRYISCGELLELKKIENLVDRYFNSGAFSRSVKFMKEFFGDYFTFFESLKNYFVSNNLFSINHSRDGLYKVFAEFSNCVGAPRAFLDILKYDFLTNNINVNTPAWSIDSYDTELHKMRTDIIESERDGVFAPLKNMNVRDILKTVHFEKFSYRVLDDLKEQRWVGAFTRTGEYLGEIIIAKVDKT